MLGGGVLSKPRLLFLCTGEGAHSAGADVTLLHDSPAWGPVQDAVRAVTGFTRLDEFFASTLGRHIAPDSPVASVALAILTAELWRSWGHEPAVVVGHSIGEVAAAWLRAHCLAVPSKELVHRVPSSSVHMSKRLPRCACTIQHCSSAFGQGSNAHLELCVQLLVGQAPLPHKVVRRPSVEPSRVGGHCECLDCTAWSDGFEVPQWGQGEGCQGTQG